MEKDIGYYKYKNYIITIKIINHTLNKYINVDTYAYHETNKFIILEIENIIDNNKLNKIDNYEINEEYSIKISYYKIKELAFFYNFNEKKQYLLFENGWCGNYKKYHWSGYLLSECFYINGKKTGKLIKYRYGTNKIEKIENYFDNKKHGEFITYDENDNIIIKTLYDNNKVIQHEIYNHMKIINFDDNNDNI